MLAEYTTTQLLLELKTRSEHGVAVLDSESTGRLDVYWGERTRCLGLAFRIAHVVQRELDILEDEEEADEDEEELPLPSLPKPPCGFYL